MRTSKEDRIWQEGFERACRIAETEGVQRLLDERRFRVITGFSGRMTSTELDRYTVQSKAMAFYTVRVAMLASLHDNMGFGKKRLQKVSEGIDKLAEYLAHGWLYWVDVVESLRKAADINLELVDGDERLLHYSRPKAEDFWSEADWIEPEEWKARLRFLGFSDDGKAVRSPEGECWEYSSEYDKIQLYDFLGGLEYAKRYWIKEEGKTEARGIA